MRITDEKREAVAHRPDLAQELIRRGVMCDRCPDHATTNVHDGTSVAFVCDRDFALLVMERKKHPRLPVLERVRRLKVAFA